MLQPQLNELYVKDHNYLWHHLAPYRKDQFPMIVAEGSGSWITDIDGNRYLDAMSGLWCVNVGYGRKELAEAAYGQLVKMPYYPLSQSHESAIHLAEKLNRWLEGDYMVFFSNSGSDANEVAFKIARQYHQQKGDHRRYKIISRYRAYHGSSMGALSATGQAQRKLKYEPLADGFVHVMPPDSYRKPEGMTEEQYQLFCADLIEETIRWEGKESVAAVIMEPAITGGGVLVPDPVYLRRVREICDTYGVLLIMDEVICGFGRSGRKFGHMNYGIKPDIVTMAKGLTSGYLPLSATAVSKQLFEVFKHEDELAHFRHVNTFGGNPAACAVAIENLNILERENLVQRSRELGERLRAGLEPLRAHPNVGDIRSFGFLMGIELVLDKETKIPAGPELVAAILADCKANGLIVGKNGDTVPGLNNVLTISPPLSSTDEDLRFIIETLQKVMNNHQ